MTRKEYILWAHKESEPAWMETVFAECKTLDELDTETWKAKECGYITRVMVYTVNEMPIFGKDIIAKTIK